MIFKSQNFAIVLFDLNRPIMHNNKKGSYHFIKNFHVKENTVMQK